MLYTNRYITSYMETLVNTISPIFKKYKFHSTISNSHNKICYKNERTNPYDEFIVEILPKTNEIITIVPIGDIPYKKTFVNMNTAIEYIKMHLDYYEKRVLTN